MPGASPLVDDLDQVRRLEDAGAAAIVMHSLFEEQIEQEHAGRARHFEAHAESFAEARTYFPDPDEYVLGPDRYLEQLHKIKQAVAVPVIASLNGTTAAGWLEYGRQLQQAGADALELNLYFLATELDTHGAEIERRVVETARMVKQGLAVPVALKLSPFYSSFAHLAREIDAIGVDGLILFNRFYQPQIDVESLEVIPHLELSNSSELLLRLRWLAILCGRVDCSLAVTGGVHTPIDAVRAIMAGAHAVQMVSALLLYGAQYLQTVLSGLTQWMEEHEYSSIQQMRGSMSLERCPDPAAFERANYMKVLQSWR
jgi:dihydroorotate dehydrogenase (fumarate)